MIYYIVEYNIAISYINIIIYLDSSKSAPVQLSPI